MPMHKAISIHHNAWRLISRISCNEVHTKCDTDQSIIKNCMVLLSIKMYHSILIPKRDFLFCWCEETRRITEKEPGYQKTCPLISFMDFSFLKSGLHIIFRSPDSNQTNGKNYELK